jgi:hypothetical protein
MIGTGLALALLLAMSGIDAVILTTGERVEGKVVRSSAAGGVTVLLPDGRTRWLHPRSVDRIDFANGTSRTLQDAPPASPQPPLDSTIPPEPPAAAVEAPRAGTIWLAFAAGRAIPFGKSGAAAPSLQGLVGNGQTQLTLEGGIRLGARLSLGGVFDFTSGNLGRDLVPACEKYGTECDAATGQLGLFLRHDFAPEGPLKPWVSLGLGYEWLSGAVFSPSAGGDSVTILTATGWQLPRAGLGIDWRAGQRLGLGLYATVALGAYERVLIDRVDVDHGFAVHGWAQLGVRAILGP